ncbi:hypothetical protein AX16_000793 [Volvariella volvacea WC 439]|nr:hypothetical protein AX16_000793 [Volvariella volvacea WC 439]
MCYVMKKVKHGGGHIMMFLYIKILDDDLLGFLKDLKIKKKDIYFQQDNDPKHTSGHAQDFFNAQSLDVLSWPPNSPDINIIKHVWDYLNCRVCIRRPLHSNKKELWEVLQKKWANIEDELGPDHAKIMQNSLIRNLVNVNEDYKQLLINIAHQTSLLKQMLWQLHNAMEAFTASLVQLPPLNDALHIFPPEVWEIITQYACIDSGRTGHSLSLVSHSMYRSTCRFRYWSLDITQSSQLFYALSLLHNNPDNLGEIQHLFLAVTDFFMCGGLEHEEESDEDKDYAPSDNKSDQDSKGSMDTSKSDGMDVDEYPHPLLEDNLVEQQPCRH